jgi:hypothetical protein
MAITINAQFNKFVQFAQQRRISMDKDYTIQFNPEYTA